MRNKEFEPDEIADAAMQVFWQKGYAATSVQDLVDGTGLSRSSLYNTFENKHKLYQEALKRYQAITTANIQKLTGDMSVQERIHQLLLSILEDELKKFFHYMESMKNLLSKLLEKELQIQQVLRKL